MDGNGINVMELCVFCGARLGIDTSVVSAVENFGHEMAQRDVGLVYGGGAAGLMGVIADAVLSAGGRVTGIIPDFLAKDEILHGSITETIIVADLFERKSKMMTMSDAFVALPGGMGTFDELLEVFTWRQLNRMSKPTAVFNHNEYFEPMFELLRHAATAGFYDLAYLDDIIISADPNQLLDSLSAKCS